MRKDLGKNTAGNYIAPMEVASSGGTRQRDARDTTDSGTALRKNANLVAP